MKPAITYATSTVMIALFLIGMGAVGAYELDRITAGACVMRFAACMLLEIILGVILTNLTDKEK